MSTTVIVHKILGIGHGIAGYRLHERQSSGCSNVSHQNQVQVQVQVVGTLSDCLAASLYSKLHCLGLSVSACRNIALVQRSFGVRQLLSQFFFSSIAANYIVEQKPDSRENVNCKMLARFCYICAQHWNRRNVLLGDKLCRFLKAKEKRHPILTLLHYSS